MIDIISFISLFIVALLWGCTNALMKKYSEGIEHLEQENTNQGQIGKLYSLISEVKFLIKNWQYLLTYSVNQLGSLLFYFTLSYCDLSIASPLTNTLTFVVTFVADGYLFPKGESGYNIYNKVGLVCICGGVLCCLIK